MNINIVILAAGRGKRMQSNTPKVMHTIANIPMIYLVLNKAIALKPNKLVIVYGHMGSVIREAVTQQYPDQSIEWVLQSVQDGTGAALKLAYNSLDNSTDSVTLVLYGDTPLITLCSLENALTRISSDTIVMLTAILGNPTGYGRVIRNELFEVTSIIEDRDASSSQKCINEINTGIYILPNKYLHLWLDGLTPHNAQSEYYLTDIISMAAANDFRIETISVDAHEALGVNSKTQLEQLERIYQHSKADELLNSGVTLLDRSRIDIRGQLITGSDCVIDINCIFEGNVVLGNGVRIGQGCNIKDSTIADNVVVNPYSLIDGATIDSDAQIGPYARIRPTTHVSCRASIGNFVEIKNSKIGTHSKVNHITYIGDTEMGDYVNVGANSVTCNYDGRYKHKTIIGNNVFIGSGTMMVAPLEIHDGCTVGAGSVITKDIDENSLAIARSDQVNIKNWKHNRHDG